MTANRTQGVRRSAPRVSPFAVGKSQDTLASNAAVKPLALVAVAVGVHVLALPVHAVVDPLAGVARPVWEDHSPKAVALAPLPVTLVLFPVWVYKRALAVHLPLLDLPAVHETLPGVCAATPQNVRGRANVCCQMRCRPRLKCRRHLVGATALMHKR